MFKVILDTSVIIGFLTSYDSSNIIKNLILQVNLKKIDLIVSSQTFQELLEVIKKPFLKDRISPKTAKFIAWYKYNSNMHKIQSNVKQCRDPNDDKFLDLILASKANYLVTYDEDLLTLKPFEGCVICKPDGLWNVLII